ncbi:hypothetical protein B0A48_14414 [Cryoendolithus antarcticus]|uniref:Uncharacterized protein n=1 Tax=Cryoendolithus antarcticus TaxID=1507870 RepID=A0A1V8SK91_9PEZI|nr:hypothetical protein B0A48_14414 [Cryoendolithus antarcticus]
MTGRGSADAPPQRLVTPLDPSLESRPVPSRRTVQPQAYGPGAAADTRDSMRPFPELEAAAVHTIFNASGPYASFGTGYHSNSDDVRRLLKHIHDGETVRWREDEQITPNPTWGYYVFLTSYTPATREKLTRALENLCEVQTHTINVECTLPVFADEAIKRFQLDLVDDQNTLEDASDDRVRAVFRAIIRGLDLTDDETVIPPPARNLVCLVLDEPAVDMLSDLRLHKDSKRDFAGFEGKTVKAIEIRWERPQRSRSSYRGVGRVSVNGLLRLYNLMTSSNGYMEDLHPSNGVP